MGTFTYNDYTQWKILPLTYLELTNSVNTHKFDKIVKGSYVRMEPVASKSKTNGGHDQIVAYKLQIRMVAYQNNIEGMDELLYDLANRDTTSLFAELERDSNTTEITIDSVTKPTVQSIGTSWEIGYNENYGPEIVITVSVLFSSDIFTAGYFNYLFDNSWE